MIDFAFLDSGTGGLPYMLALKDKQPDAKCVYLGDTVHFPYGQKSQEEIIQDSSQAINLIISKWNPKAIVIACNTISVTALEQLRKTFNLPIVGTVPAIKLAASVTRNKKIGLLATNATVNHPYCKKLARDFASDCLVVNRGDPALVSFIEKDFFTSTKEEKIAAIKPALDFFAQNGCDTVILGCTHFTHIADIAREVAGPEVTIVDSRDGVSKQALKQCKVEGTQGTEDGAGVEDCTFFVTKADKTEEQEYVTLCRNLNIPWGGVVTSDR